MSDVVRMIRWSIEDRRTVRISPRKSADAAELLHVLELYCTDFIESRDEWGFWGRGFQKGGRGPAWVVEVQLRPCGIPLLTRTALLAAYATKDRLFGENLEGVVLVGEHLPGINLRSVHLEGANFQGANLRGANLRDSNLQKANLSGADLTGADLSGAWLYGATLEGANLDGVKIVGAHLKYTNVGNTCLLPRRL